MTAEWEAARDIVMGIDPARDWHLPLAWAADEAERRGLPLRLVLAVPPEHDTRHAGENSRQTALRRAGAARLDEAQEWARERNPELDVTTELVAGSPAHALVAQARHAHLVVLGSRHLGRIAEFFSAGSTLVPVTAQAPCPVAVVGDAEHVTQQPPYVVVGIDGSTSAKDALTFAFDEADRRGAELRVVRVRQKSMLMADDERAAIAEERILLVEATSGLTGESPDVRVTHEVLSGHPVEELARAAEHALAVVVGRRGRGGYTGMRLGSVAHGLLHRAHCPVITVPSG